MSIFMLVVAVLAFMGILYLLYRRLQRRLTSKQHSLIRKKLASFAIEQALLFSSQDMLAEDTALCLDGVNRKLLFMKTTGEGTDPVVLLIDLDTITHCSVRRVHRSVYSPYRHSGPEVFLSRVSLCLHHDATPEPWEIVFYDRLSNLTAAAAASLYKKAFSWETLITKMIRCPHLNRA